MSRAELRNQGSRTVHWMSNLARTMMPVNLTAVTFREEC